MAHPIYPSVNAQNLLLKSSRFNVRGIKRGRGGERINLFSQVESKGGREGWRKLSLSVFRHRGFFFVYKGGRRKERGWCRVDSLMGFFIGGDRQTDGNDYCYSALCDECLFALSFWWLSFVAFWHFVDTYPRRDFSLNSCLLSDIDHSGRDHGKKLQWEEDEESLRRKQRAPALWALAERRVRVSSEKTTVLILLPVTTKEMIVGGEVCGLKKNKNKIGVCWVIRWWRWADRPEHVSDAWTGLLKEKMDKDDIGARRRPTIERVGEYKGTPSRIKTTMQKK